MDTISATIAGIQNYGEKFLIVLEYQIPHGVARIRLLDSLGEDPTLDLSSHLPGELLQVIVTTLGSPTKKIGDTISIQVFYDDEAV